MSIFSDPVSWLVGVAMMATVSAATDLTPTTEPTPTPATVDPVPAPVEAPPAPAPVLSPPTPGQACLNGKHAVSAATAGNVDCVPWPTHCMNGQRFVIPADPNSAGGCRPPTLVEMVEDVFGPEAPIAERVIKCESDWNPRAVGPPVGRRRLRALGLMQLLGHEGLARRLGVTDLFDPLGNLIVGAAVRKTEGWQAWSCY